MSSNTDTKPTTTGRQLRSPPDEPKQKPTGAVAGEKPLHEVPKTVCCICAIGTDWNPLNMCMTCIKSKIDITEGLPKEYILEYCPECQRYLQPPKYWSRADFESRELMVICLKKIRGLNKYNMTDATFLWTEEHSKRLKVKLVLQKEVFAGTILQQSCVCEYTIHWRQCDRCARAATGQDQWAAVVQLRQRVDHKRTFLYLEQLIIKNRMHEDTIKIENHPSGLDFYFNSDSHARQFKQFISGLAPCKGNEAVQLVSHDSKANTAIEHLALSLEIAPICREDLVCLPPNVRSSLGGIGPLVLVHKIYSSIVFLDPKTLQAQELQGLLYWKNAFQVLASSPQLVDFYIVDMEPDRVVNGKFRKGNATVQLSSEVGEEREWVVPTHLGNVLKAGDTAKGYFLETMNTNDANLEKYSEDVLLDVILVRKHYPNQIRKRTKRNWKVKRLAIDGAAGEGSGPVGKKGGRDRASGVGGDAAKEEEEFLDEIERDRDLRDEFVLYKKELTAAEQAQREKKAAAAATAGGAEGGEDEDDDDDDEVPEVDVDELLDEYQQEEEVVEKVPVEGAPEPKEKKEDDDADA